INLRVRRQFNPSTRRIASKPGNWNEFAASSGCNECMPCKIDTDPWEPGVERFVGAWLVCVCERQIAKCDTRGEFTARAFQVELAPSHCAVRVCSRVARAGDADRIRHDGAARYQKSDRQYRELHSVNVRTRTRTSS